MFSSKLNHLRSKIDQKDWKAVIDEYQPNNLSQYSKNEQIQLYCQILIGSWYGNLRGIAKECAERMKNLLLVTKKRLPENLIQNYNQNIAFASPGINFKFDKSNTFIIGLDRETERMKRIHSRMKYFNLEYTFWRGTRPNEVIDTFVKSTSPGQRACTQSHLNIYKHMIAQSINYVLIFEDDACLDLKWFQKLKQFNLDYSWDIILLNASEEETKRDQWVKAKEQYMLAAYIISRKAAHWILKVFKGGYYCTDWMTTRLQLLKHSYTYFPWLAIQEYKMSVVQTSEHMKADYDKMIRLLKKANYDIKNYYV